MAVYDKKRKQEPQDELAEILSQQLQASLETIVPLEAVPNPPPAPVENVNVDDKDYLQEIKKEIVEKFHKLSPHIPDSVADKVCKDLLEKTHLPEEVRKSIIGEMIVKLIAIRYQKQKEEEKRIKTGIRCALEKIEKAVAVLTQKHESGIVDLSWKKDFKLFVYEREHKVEMFRKPAVSNSDIKGLKSRMKLDDPDWKRVVDATTVFNMVKDISKLVRQFRFLSPEETEALKVARLEIISYLMEGELLFVKKPRKLGELLVGLSELLQNPLGVDGQRNHPELLKTLQEYPEFIKREDAFSTYVKLVGNIGAE